MSGFAPDVQVILRAMQRYGVILADNGSAWYISGAPDERWDNDVLRELRQVKGSNFEAVDVSSFMTAPNPGRIIGKFRLFLSLLWRKEQSMNAEKNGRQPLRMASFDYTRFYDAIAPFYGFGQGLLPVWQRYVESVLPWLPLHGRLLEIGPGPGVLLAKLARCSELTVGLDLSAGMLGECRQRLSSAGLPVRLVNASASQLPLASATFDGVVMTFAFSAFPDGAGAMAEVARVLRTGGVVALVDACPPSDGNWAGVQLAQAWQRFGDFMRDEAALMRGAGLEIVERKEFGAFNSIRLTVGRK